MKRRIFVASLSTVFMLPLLSCSNRKSLIIGSHIWPGAEFMFLARKMGWLEGENISLIETSSASESMKLLASGQLDGAALTLEQVLRVRSMGVELTVASIFDIRQSDTLFDVLALKTELASSQKTALKLLINGHFKAQQYFRTNTQDAAHRMAERMQLSVLDVLNTLRGLQMPGVSRNRKLLSHKGAHLTEKTQSLMKQMIREGLIATPDTQKNLFTASYLPGGG